MLFRPILISIMACFAAIAPAQAQMLLRDAEIEEWLDEYSRPLFRAAGLPADQIDILLIGADEPNAFAGGFTMGVFTGLITHADTPNQVEGVIAHEAAHIAGGHSARTAEAMAAASRPMLLSLVLAAGAIAAGAPQAGIGIMGLGQTIGMASILRYSRGQEASADQAAVTYLDSLGKSSAGLIEFFGKLRNRQVLTSRRVNPYIQSHPLSNARITALTERATASRFYNVKDSVEDIAKLKLIQAKINGFLQETNQTLRQYPLIDQSDPARYARAVAYYRASMLEKALPEIEHLIATYPENPYYHELKGQMLFEFGHIEKSIEPHERSVELAPTKALLRINHGRALVALEDAARYPEAVRALKSALLIEPDNGFGWFELARAYAGLGQESMADLAMAEARFHGGAKGEAAIFARRAMNGLQRGTPEYRQAADIVAAAANLQDKDRPRFERREEEEESPRPAPRERDRRPEGEVPDPTLY